MKHLKRTFWFWTLLMGAVLAVAFLGDGCGEGGSVAPTAPVSIEETALTAPQQQAPAPESLERIPVEAAQQTRDFRAAEAALRMVAIAKLFHGNDWADHLPTSREDMAAVYAKQSEWMDSDHLELQKDALEIIADPSELAAWQRRIGDVVLSPKEVQRLQEARERFEQYKLDHRRRLEEKRRNNPGQEGGFQGADACGGGGFLGMLGVQDDADCGYCTDDCYAEADRRLAGLYYWQETVCAEHEDDEEEYDICIAETQEEINRRFDQYFEECCNSNCHTCPAGWCTP